LGDAAETPVSVCCRSDAGFSSFARNSFGPYGWFDARKGELGNGRPFSEFAAGRHMPDPLLGIRQPAKRCVERAVGISEDETDFVADARALAEVSENIKGRRDSSLDSCLDSGCVQRYNYKGIAAGPARGRRRIGSVRAWICSRVASEAISRRRRPCGVTSMKASSVTM
jgi:hypothetical protein